MRKRSPGELQGAQPFVVIRWMACAYDQRQVWFGGDGLEDPRRLAIVVRDPGGEGAEREVKRRDALLAKLRELTAQTGRRMCAVFGRKDAVYVELDGTMTTPGEVPSGGVDLGALSLEPVANEENS